MNIKFQKLIATMLMGVFIASQILVMGSILLIPKPAQAQVVVAVAADFYDVLKEIGIAALRQVAVQYANKFLTRFVDKLQDKYKIRNFIYYDQVLTDYYLNRYIADRITDPDLRNIYSLLERGFISGAPTGTTGGPDPRKALIPRINAAITAVYLKKGGLDPNKIKNPNNFSSDAEYFDAMMAFYSSHPSFTEQNLQGEFGAFQSSATTASQLEVLVGNGLKAGRIIGGTCSVVVPNPNPTSCRQAGGVWRESAVDQARSFIDNPTIFTAQWADSAIKQITGNNFDPNNYKAALGSFIGSFLFNQLALNRPGGTLPDSPDIYLPEDPELPDGVPVDSDGDGITDGYDINADGLADICVYGGVPDGAGPPCKGSSEAMNNNPPPLTCAEVPTAIACTVPNRSDVVDRVKAYLAAQNISTAGFCGAFEITRRVAWALRGDGAGVMTTFHSGQCNGLAAGIIAYSDGSGVDILGDEGGANTTSWNPGPDNPEAGVDYRAPTDPGDPPGSY